MDGISQVGASNRVSTDRSVLSLENALKAEQEAARGLIDALPQQGSSNPPNLDQNIDVVAYFSCRFPTWGKAGRAAALQS